MGKGSERVRLVPVTDAEFDGVFAEMENNFIREERRDREAARALLREPRYTFFHVEDEGERVGFVTLWRLDDTTFVEHFVTYEKYRNRGVGRRVMSLLADSYGSLVLEAEHPETEMAARRLGFYGRCGFYQNDLPYLQPPYREGGDGVPLILLSYPAPLSDPRATARELYQTVYRRPYEEYGPNQ